MSEQAIDNITSEEQAINTVSARLPSLLAPSPFGTNSIADLQRWEKHLESQITITKEATAAKVALMNRKRNDSAGIYAALLMSKTAVAIGHVLGPRFVCAQAEMAKIMSCQRRFKNEVETLLWDITWGDLI